MKKPLLVDYYGNAHPFENGVTTCGVPISAYDDSRVSYPCPSCSAKEPKKTDTLLINLYGGPGAGKSTLARGISSKLSLKSYLCEYVDEVAKGWVWEERFKSFDYQLYLFSKQHRNIARLMGKVDIIVTDGPLLFSLLYGSDKVPSTFEQLVLEISRSIKSVNLFIERDKQYEPRGRMQTKEEAIEKDHECLQMLSKYKIPFVRFTGNEDGLAKAVDFIDAVKSCTDC